MGTPLRCVITEIKMAIVAEEKTIVVQGDMTIPKDGPHGRQMVVVKTSSLMAHLKFTHFSLVNDSLVSTSSHA